MVVALCMHSVSYVILQCYVQYILEAEVAISNSVHINRLF